MTLPLNGEGVGYSCSSLISGMVGQDFEVTVVTSRCTLQLPSVNIVEVVPSWARYLPYRWVKRRADEKVDDVFLTRVNQLRSRRRAAYLWSNASVKTIELLRGNEIKVFREQFNCHTNTAKRILDDAYHRLGVEPAHAITVETIDSEVRMLDAVDYVFCPGPNVATSLLENGIPSSKLLMASYGWDPARLATSRTVLPRSDGITALFVGSICVRKGAHLLLDYWARSKIRGRLVLAGAMEPTIKEKCAHLLAREDVVVLDYSRDVGPLYRSADVFLFPTLEEGSPLVVYEACACGLPIVTTSMGAGGIVRNDHEGYVIEPYKAPEWIAAIRSLAENKQLRQRMSGAAAERAAEHVWPAVADRRRRQMERILAAREEEHLSEAEIMSDLSA